MLPEPKGTFNTIGEKICRELVHFKLATSIKNAFEITEKGKYILELLSNKNYIELRRVMVKLHLETYENLRLILESHWKRDYIYFPIVDSRDIIDKEYVISLLKPNFDVNVNKIVNNLWEKIENEKPKNIEIF